MYLGVIFIECLDVDEIDSAFPFDGSIDFGAADKYIVVA